MRLAVLHVAEVPGGVRLRLPCARRLRVHGVPQPRRVRDALPEVHVRILQKLRWQKVTADVSVDATHNMGTPGLILCLSFAGTEQDPDRMGVELVAEKVRGETRTLIRTQTRPEDATGSCVQSSVWKVTFAQTQRMFQSNMEEQVQDFWRGSKQGFQ